MFFVDDGRRVLLSKQATAPHSEKIATECQKLKFSIEKIKKVNLSKKTGVRRSAKPISVVYGAKRNNPIARSNNKKKSPLWRLFRN
jgi:hypothetical protein